MGKGVILNKKEAVAMSFGENVGFYRHQLNITQEELAERLFVSRQTVSRWETDSALPDVETIIRLCDVFGCDMDTLVRGSASEAKELAGLENVSETVMGAEKIIKEMKEKLRKKRLLSERIIGAIAAPVALLSFFAYFLCGFIWDLWHPAWLIFVGALVVIAVSAVIADAVIGVTDQSKKIRQEKRKLKLLHSTRNLNG